MTPESSYTTPIAYHDKPLAELRQMHRDVLETLVSEKSPDVLVAARRRFYALKDEFERRGEIMGRVS